MPLVGLAGEVSWRLAFVVFLFRRQCSPGSHWRRALPTAPPGQPVRRSATCVRRASARRWALGELFANSAWAGTLVFSGALFTEVHGMSPTATGLGLAAVAGAYLLGNLLAGPARFAQRAASRCRDGLLASVAVALGGRSLPTS